MRPPPFTTRDLAWLLLLLTMACAVMATGHEALRQVLAVVAVIAAICWLVAAA